MKKKGNGSSPAATAKLRFDPIDRGSVKSRVYAHVKQALMRGEFEPGEVVTIDSLAQAFGTSHMPVREALGRLVTAHALVALPNRSVAVPMISVDALRDIMHIRAELEGLAGRLAAEQWDEESMRPILDNHRKMAEAITVEDVTQYLAVHQAFHFSVYASSRSVTLPTLIETLWLQSGPYLNLLATDESFQPDGSEHDGILKGLLARDAQATDAAIRKGIFGALRTMEALVSARASPLHADDKSDVSLPLRLQAG